MASGGAGAAEKMGYRPALDGLRGIAVALVVLAHLEVPGFVNGGAVGVTLFFVLSGYLITGIVTREQDRTGTVSMRGFCARRARRLLPALVVFLAVYVSVAALVGASGRSGPAVLSIFYVANWARIGGADFHELGHMWSLAVEEQFYLVWPLILVAVHRWASRPVVWVAALLALSVVWRAMVWRQTGDWSHTYHGTDAVASSLLFGALAAHLRVRVSARAAWLALAVLTVLALVLNQHEDIGTFRPLYAYLWVSVIGVASAVLILGAHHMRWLAWRPLVYAGLVSYGWYLWHVPMLKAVQPDVYADPHPVLAVVAVVASLGMALASHRWIESRWLHARSNRSADQMNCVAILEASHATSIESESFAVISPTASRLPSVDA